MTHLDKVEKIAREDRELVRSELACVAEWLRERHPAMNYAEIRKFIGEMLTVSV